MSDHALRDNHAERRKGPLSGPDAEGHAAILLVESLLHELIGRSVLSVAHAIDVVAVAADVEDGLRSDSGGVPTGSSGMILGSIRESLSTDLRGD